MNAEFDALFAEHQKLLGELQAMRNVKRQWIGLTDAERDDFWKADQMTGAEWRELFDAVEAKLKQKNNG